MFVCYFDISYSTSPLTSKVYREIESLYVKSAKKN